MVRLRIRALVQGDWILISCMLLHGYLVAASHYAHDDHGVGRSIVHMKPTILGLHFQADNLTKVVCCAEENPEMSLGDIGKRLGELWREMGAEEKKMYEVRFMHMCKLSYLQQVVKVCNHCELPG